MSETETCLRVHAGDVIDIANEKQLHRWVRELGCTPKQLRFAMFRAGSQVDAVCDYMRRSTSWTPGAGEKSG